MLKILLTMFYFNPQINEKNKKANEIFCTNNL